MPMTLQTISDAIGSTRSITLPFPSILSSVTSAGPGTVKMSPFNAFCSCFAIGPYSTLNSTRKIIMMIVRIA